MRDFPLKGRPSSDTLKEELGIRPRNESPDLMLRFTLASGMLLALAVPAAYGQQDITVQLPTWNVTTVGTTVSVPDGGSALLGGINRAREGSVSRGVPLLSNIPGVNRLFKNRAIGREVGASSMSIVPRIIVLEEEEFRQTGVSPETLAYLERQQQTAAFAAGVDPAVARKAQFLAANITRHDAGSTVAGQADTAPLLAVEDVRRQNRLAAEQRAREAAELLAEGRRARSEGKTNVARIYYRMAARQASGELLDEVAAQLASISDVDKGTALAER
jgi:hypothetical protein